MIACLVRGKNLLVRYGGNDGEFNTRVTKATASQRAQFPRSLPRRGPGSFWLGQPPAPYYPGIYGCTIRRSGTVSCGGMDLGGSGVMITEAGRLKVCISHVGNSPPCRTVYRP